LRRGDRQRHAPATLEADAVGKNNERVAMFSPILAHVKEQVAC